MLGVLASAFSAASVAPARTASMSFSRSAVATAAAAASRITVSIVPSTGRGTAPYAAVLAEARAWARSRPLKRRRPAKPSESPRTTWLRITPELPRAPKSAPSRSRSATPSTLESSRT